MPLLKRGTDILPQNLFDLPGGEFTWWVAHTRSRREKSVARHLLNGQIPFYLPTREKQVRRAGRTLVSYLPLFPGYVFFRGDGHCRREVLRSHLLVRVLEVREQDVLNGELRQLRRLQESGAELVPLPDLVAGDAVRIVEGPFQGYSGVVLRGPSRLRLVVSISMLRKAVAVEFERGSLTPLLAASRPTSTLEVPSAVA
jgi:transcription antitermination factor NusG